jgi:hypothetical protein
MLVSLVFAQENNPNANVVGPKIQFEEKSHDFGNNRRDLCHFCF